MKTKALSSSLFILVFILTSCGQETATPLPVTQMSVVTQQPTAIPTQTAIPLSTVWPSPTVAPPYPTANTVKANAVAFIERVGLDYSLWIANVDGTGERKLVDIERSADDISNYLLQWSPDGKWISYISGNDLWITSPDGSTKRKLLSSIGNAGKLYRYVWSPDGSKIAYENIVSYKQTETPTPGPESGKIPISIEMIDLATGEIATLSSHESNIFMPLLWSPDGQYLLFVKDFSLVFFELANHKVIQEIKRGCSAWRNMSWSPNSKWFYHIDHGNGYYNMWICVSGLNGTSWQIEDVGVVISPPVWDKTGDYLYFVVGEMDLDIGPNWCKNQRLVRYDVETRKVETLLPLEEYGSTGFPWTVSISPNKQMLELYSYTHYEDYSHPGHIYVDASRSKQNRIVILDIQSLSTKKFALEFEGEIKGQFPPPIWSNDNEKTIFFLENLVRQSYGISYSDSGSFYSLDIKTGEVSKFSGVHAVENAVISSSVAIP